ncbi:MAG: OmpA family protein, partial [Rhodomicrobium sp.]
ISLTDDANFSMFKIASPEPCPQLVLVLQKVGELINKYPGQIIVRGHTDGRPYAGDRYGNWRLSVNRATMAYYMLLRGKLDESRFLALEGYADRNPKNKADPLAGNNRRIEILIKGADKP